MIFSKSTLAALFIAVVATLSQTDAAGNLRRSRVRRLGPKVECTVQVQTPLHINPTDDEDEEYLFDCELDEYETGGISSQIFPLGISKEQKKELREMLKAGDIQPNESRLDIGGGIWNGVDIKVPPGQMKDKVKKGKGVATARRLAESQWEGERGGKSTDISCL